MTGADLDNNAKLVSELLESLYRGEMCLDSGDNFVFLENCCVELTGYNRGSEILAGERQRRQTFAISCTTRFTQASGQFVKSSYTPALCSAAFVLHFREDDEGNMFNPIIWPVDEYPFRSMLIRVPEKDIRFVYGQPEDPGDKNAWMDVITDNMTGFSKDHPPLARLGALARHDGGFDPLCEFDSWQLTRLAQDVDSDWVKREVKIVTGVGQEGWGSF